MRLKQHRGFTLIELMIVVAVVAILATVAIPAYNDSVRKSRRGQAKADLMELAQNLERFHTVHNTYGPAGGTPAFTLPFAVSPREAAGGGGTAYYNLAITPASHTASAFVLTATPVEGTSQASDSCGTLSITHAGQKSATGVGQCW